MAATDRERLAAMIQKLRPGIRRELSLRAFPQGFSGNERLPTLGRAWSLLACA
jgi:hypothetical protein